MIRCLSLCLVAYTDAECQISAVSQAVVAWVHPPLPFAQETVGQSKIRLMDAFGVCCAQRMPCREHGQVSAKGSVWRSVELGVVAEETSSNQGFC